MSDTGALTPGQSVFQVLQDLKQESGENKRSSSEEERLAELHMLPGFKDLKKHIEARVEFLKHQARGEIGKDSMETIGLKAVIYDIVEDELLGVIKLIENAYEQRQEESKT